MNGDLPCFPAPGIFDRRTRGEAVTPAEPPAHQAVPRGVERWYSDNDNLPKIPRQGRWRSLD